MRLALLADIHGNLPAFEAALSHAKKQSPDLILLLGDIVNGCPDSRACWDLAQSLGFPLLRGNHERYMTDWERPDAPPEWRSERFGPVQWTSRQFTQTELAAIRALPITMQLPEFPDTVFCHASPDSDQTQAVAFTTDAELTERFPSLTAPVFWVFRGHNHHQMVRLWQERTLVTVGATGLPLDGSCVAQYTIIDRLKIGGWHLTHHAIPYDLNLLRERFRQTNYLQEAGPMARLYYREALTACAQIAPFLKAYKRMCQVQGDIPLSDAISLYLKNEHYV